MIIKGNGLSYSVPKYERSEVLHCQLDGKSEFIISPALDRNAVYPYKKGVGPTNLAGISLYSPDMGKFPNSGNLYKIYFIVEKGDCLFIPAYWWFQIDTYNEPNLYVKLFFETHSRYLDILMKGVEDDKI